MCADAPVPPAPATLAPIRRGGSVARARLREAAPVVRNVVDWLTQRGLSPTVERATAELAGLTSTPTADAVMFVPSGNQVIIGR